MAIQEIIVSERGVESVRTQVDSVSDGVSAGRLTEKTALAVRLLHDSAKAETTETDPAPINYLDAALGSYMFRCACGRRFVGPWDEAREEAIDHVEQRHAEKSLRKDIDALEDTIEALIVPSPLFDFEAPEPVVIDHTFKSELLTEITNILAHMDKDLPGTSKDAPAKRAEALMDHCGWGDITGANLDEVKVKILDEPDGKKVYGDMRDDFLCTVGVFFSQVGKLSKRFRGKE